MSIGVRSEADANPPIRLRCRDVTSTTGKATGLAPRWFGFVVETAWLQTFSPRFLAAVTPDHGVSIADRDALAGDLGVAKGKEWSSASRLGEGPTA